MWTDLRLAFRTLLRSPLFTGVAVASLALGIGANTAIFSLLDQVLLRLLPVRDPKQLVVFHSNGQNSGWNTTDNSETVFSYPRYRDLRDRQQVLEGVFARASAAVTVLSGGNSERAGAELVSGNYFELLGARVAAGRLLNPGDDRIPDGHPVLVLSHGYWTRRFAANPAIIGQSVTVNGRGMTVIGVAGPGFRGVLSGSAPDIFVPIAMKRAITPTWDGLEDRRIFWLNIFGRLPAGVTASQAALRLQPVYKPMLAEEAEKLGPARTSKARDEFLGQTWTLLSASQGINDLREAWQSSLVALMAMVGLVLLIACANVAGLMIARSAGRGRETAIRLAIGASRFGILRQFFAESLLLSVAGGAFGLLVAAWTGPALLGLLPSDYDNLISARLEPRMLLFCFALALASSLLFGLAPAIQATRADVAPALQNHSRGLAGSSGHARLRRMMVLAQVALSLVLLAGAGLFARSLWNLRNLDPGFRIDRIWSFSVDPKLAGYSKERGYAFYTDLHARLAALTGVTEVGPVELRPMTNSDRGANVSIEGYPNNDDQDLHVAVNPVGPGFFRTLGVPFVAGRDFTDRDLAPNPRYLVINEAFARRFFPGQNPLGRRMMFGSSNKPVYDREIIGVIRNFRHNLRQAKFDPTVFLPYTQDTRLNALSFYVRTASPGDAVAKQIRTLVRSLDPNLPVFDLASVEAQRDESIYSARMIAVLSACFGGLATLLAAIGLYGLVAYAVARRTAEIGIRIALGALRRDVLWLVLREVARLTAVGLVAGLALALAAGRWIESQLYGVAPRDFWTLVGASLVLALIVLAAAWLPARRAARIDPMNALRYE